MRARGWNVEGVIPEDVGYCVMLARKPFMVWIGCGNRREGADEWIAFVAAEGALLKRVLRMLDPSKEISRVSEVLGEIMKSAPGVRAYSVEPGCRADTDRAAMKRRSVGRFNFPESRQWLGAALVLKEAGLKQKQPTPANLRVHLTGAALPVERLLRPPVAPQRVNVDDSESAIGLSGHYHAQCPPVVMH
jgi:hypothetical protein